MNSFNFLKIAKDKLKTSTSKNSSLSETSDISSETNRIEQNKIKFISSKQLIRALIFSIILIPLFPPMQTLSELGVLTIAPNQFITASEVPEYIYEHLNKDFTAYFGSSVDKSKSLVIFQTQGKSFEWSLLPKDLPASPSGILAPEATPSAIPSISPSASPSSNVSNLNNLGNLVTPTPTLDPLFKLTQSLNDTSPQSTLSAQMQIDQMALNQEVSTISSQTTQIASDTAKIGEQIKTISGMELIRGTENDADFVLFKNADKNINIKLQPEANGIKQTIQIQNVNYNWPLVFALNPNGLTLNKNERGEYVLAQPTTNIPVINLGTFIARVPKTGATETIQANYAIEDSKLVITLSPSGQFLTDNQNEEMIIENSITPQKPDELKTQEIPQKRQIISGDKAKATFTENSDTHKYELDRGVFKAKLFDKDNTYSFNFETGGKSVNLSLLNQTNKTVNKVMGVAKDSGQPTDQIESNNITQNGLDIRYQPLLNGVKEEIVITDKNIISSFANSSIINNDATMSASQIPLQFKITQSGTKMTQNSDGTIAFADDKTNERLFYFHKPFAVDANNNKTNDVFFRVNNDVLTIIIDQKWLEDPTRVYPIIIDPTVTISGVASYSTASNYSFQRKSWYDGTRYWIAFQNGTAAGAAVNFYYSTDNGASWTINSSASLTDAVTYTETSVEDTSVANTATSGTTAFTGQKCDRVQAGISGKIAKVAYYVGLNEVIMTASVKQESASSCSSPGASIPTDVFYTEYLNPGVATITFAGEGTPIAKSGYYCVCLNFTSSKIWYGTSDTNHYKRVWVRPLNADFSVEGDESNAYIVYRDVTTDRILARKAASYPGTTFSWGTATQIWDGGTGGTDGQVRFDMPNIASSGGKINFTARKSTYAGTTTTDFQSRSNNQTLGLRNYYEDARYMPINPSQDGVLDKVSVYVIQNAPTGYNANLYAKLCYDDSSSACPSGVIEELYMHPTSLTMATIDFTTDPYVSQERRYKIFFKQDVSASYNNMFVKAEGTTLIAPCAWDGNCGTGGIGIGLKYRSLVQIIGKRAALDLTGLADTFSVRPSSGNNANMANQIVSGLGISAGKILFLFQDGTSLKWFTFDGSSTYSAEAALASLTTPNNLTQVFSGAAATDGSFIVTYIDSSGHLHSRTLASDLTTWGSEEDIDTNTDNIYVTTSLGQGANIFFTAWFRSSQNSTIYFARRPVGIPQWSTAQSLNTSAGNSLFLSSLLISSEKIAIVRTVGTSAPFDIVTDMIDTGLGKQMRHGKTFENEIKQPEAY